MPLTRETNRFRRTLLGSVLVPILLMAVLAGVFLKQIGSLLALHGWVDHTDQVIAETHYLQTLLIDQETGLRGYLVTGAVEFLEPFEKGERAFPGELNRVTGLVGDNPTQRGDVRTIADSAAAWQSYAHRMIALRRRGADYREYGINREGKRRMDALRALLGGFLAREQQLRSTRAAAAARASRVATETALVTTLLLGSVAAVLLRQELLGLVRWFRDALDKREAAARENAHLFKEISRYAEELEERVQARTAALVSRNEELQAFSYTVSHDLRAPVRAVEGFSQALEEDYGERLGEEGREFIEAIRSASRRMDRLIEDLLAYSRLSQADISLGPVSLDRVLEEAVGELPPSERAAVRVERPLPDVAGHFPTLVQIAGNLLTNALKFVRPGVQPRVRVWTEPSSGFIRLWVEDNGIGIEPEHQERIFRVFERLHGIETYPGTGVGLAIVRRAAERLGGHAGVEPDPQQGSRFWVDFRPVEALPLVSNPAEERLSVRPVERRRAA